MLSEGKTFPCNIIVYLEKKDERLFCGVKWMKAYLINLRHAFKELSEKWPQSHINLKEICELEFSPPKIS